MIVFRRVQHAVGQGFFHSASIELHSNTLSSGPASLHPPGGIRREFRYVYDCGEFRDHHDERNQEIDSLIDDFGINSILDFVFVSHADIDHVNGLARLLHRSAGLHVDTVVMPLIPPAERLASWARARLDAAGTNDGFYDRFISDPAATLAEGFEVRQVLMIDGSHGEAPDEQRNPELEPPENDGPVRLEVFGASGSTSSNPRIREVARTIRFELTNSLRQEKWLLTPYVDEPIASRSDDFVAALALELGKSESSLRSRLADHTELLKLIKNDGASIKNAYRSVAPTINSTSLSLYSGPAAPASRAQSWIEVGGIPLSWGYRSSRTGWLGTGDAELNKKNRMDRFLAAYAEVLPFVGTLTVPHHGSANNRVPRLLDALAACPSTICVSAADPPRGWRHPSTEVMIDIASRGMQHLVVTSASSSRLSEGGSLGHH